MCQTLEINAENLRISLSLLDVVMRTLIVRYYIVSHELLITLYLEEIKSIVLNCNKRELHICELLIDAQLFLAKHVYWSFLS